MLCCCWRGIGDRGQRAWLGFTRCANAHASDHIAAQHTAQPRLQLAGATHTARSTQPSTCLFQYLVGLIVSVTDVLLQGALHVHLILSALLIRFTCQGRGARVLCMQLQRITARDK